LKGLILSGGIASRLWPITYNRAKQLLPLANKPILFYGIESLAKAGIKDIGIIVGQTRDEIMKAVGDGSRWGVKISYIHQQSPDGLAHAVKVARPFLGDADFLMFLGDNMIRDDLKDFIDQFYRDRLNALIVLDKVKNPQQFGVAVIQDDRIVKLLEKPKEFVSDMAIVGLYIFDKNVHSSIDRIKPSKRNELEITDAIQDMIEMGFEVGYGRLKKWWKDTGTPLDMLEANRRLLDEIEGSIEGTTDENTDMKGKVVIGKESRTVNCKIRGPVVIGENCFIKDAELGPYTVVGRGSRIENCKIEDSIIMENCKLINIEKRICNSLIGEDVEISCQGSGSDRYSLVLGSKNRIKSM